MWQGCHKIGEESSKIVPLGAPLIKRETTASQPYKVHRIWILQQAQPGISAYEVLAWFVAVSVVDSLALAAAKEFRNANT